jgi:hypothetical protein
LAHQVAKRSDAHFITIFVDTPEEVTRHRRLVNKRSGARRDVTDEQFDEIVQVMRPPTEDEDPFVFHYDDQLDSWIDRNAANWGG